MIQDKQYNQAGAGAGSDNSEDLFTYGERCLAEGRLPEAVTAFRRIGINADNRGPVKFNLGIAYLLGGNIDAAIACLTEVTDSDGDLDLGLFSLADKKLIAPAINSFKAAMEQNTDLIRAAKAAAAFLVLNCFSDALASLDDLGRQDNLLPQLPLWRSLALLRLGNYEDACESAAAYCHNVPQDAYGFYVLGLAHFSLKETAKAIEAYRLAVEAVPGHMKASLRLAQAYMVAEQYTHVESILRRLLEKHPACIDAYFGLGKCLEKQYRTEEAVKYIAKAADRAPGFSEYQVAAGKAFKNLGQHEKALTYFRRAASLRGDDGDIRYCLGSTLCALERYSEAVPELERAIQLDPRNGYAFYSLGTAYAKLNYYDKAVKMLTLSLELNPRSQDARYEIGVICYKSGSYKKAIEELQAYVKFAPADIRSHYYIGLCLRALGRLKEAEEMLLEVMKNSAEAEQAVYRNSAECLQQGDTEAALAELEKAASRDLPVRKSDFFEVSMLQFFGTKSIRLYRGVMEEREYGSNVENSLFQFMESLSAITDLRDAYCQSHSQRVAAIADVLTEKLKIDEEMKSGIHVGACLHDSGKMALPDVAMYYASGNGDNVKDCNALYEQHTLLGYENFSSMPFPDGVLDAIQYHHELWDGSGFPSGLKEEAIPLSAQIVGLADYYERLLTKGGSQGVLSPEQALADIKQHSGHFFNPRLVTHFEKEFARINNKLAELRV
ncbi:MAG: tetratricopeptide repeat protein [Candidatus Bruticola sp.]